MRFVFAALFCLSAPFLSATPLAALCIGPSFESHLTEQDLAEIDTAIAAIPFAQGNFWQAEKDGTTLTILGTMHLPDPRHDATLARFAPHIQSADLLLVESTLEDQTAMQIHLSNTPGMMLITDGPSLIDILDPATWDAIKQAAEARGVPGFMAAKMQPWFLTMTLAMPACALADIAGGAEGLDTLLMQVAANHQVPVAPLEPWQDMLALLTTGTFDEQIDALRTGLVPTAISDAMMTSLTNAYFAGRTAYSWELSRFVVDFLPDMTAEEFETQMAQLEELLLVQRNANWIPVIEAAAARHDTIAIAFGAAHLFGTDGVLFLLESNGWSVSRL